MRTMVLGLLAAALMLVGCTGADFGDSGSDDSASLVHVDLEARRAGVVTWTDGRPWLDPGPVAVDPGTAIALRVPAPSWAEEEPETHIVRVGAGEIVEIFGGNAGVRRFARNADVSEDAFVVACDEEAAFRVANALGDEVTVSLHAPHGYQLDGHDVLGRASRTSALRAVADVLFVRASAPASSAADAGPPAASPSSWGPGAGGALDTLEVGRSDGLLRHATIAPITPDERPADATRSSSTTEGGDDVATDGVPLDVLEAADLVGYYRAGGRVLVLDAEGGYVLEGGSTERARGHWVLRGGRVELEPFGQVTPLQLVPTEDGSLGGAGVSAFRPVLGPHAGFAGAGR